LLPFFAGAGAPAFFIDVELWLNNSKCDQKLVIVTDAVHCTFNLLCSFELRPAVSSDALIITRAIIDVGI